VKIAILADNEDSFVKPTAEGLQRMMLASGAEARIFYDGLERLGCIHLPTRQYIRNPSRGSLGGNLLRYLFKEIPAFYSFVIELRKFDAIVVVNSIGRAYFTSFFSDESVRQLLPHVPLVLYDLFYLPTRGFWGKWLKEGKPERGISRGGNWGMERYDWYLVASIVSECPVPPGVQPYSVVGLNLDDGTLRPEPKDEFVALIDFEQPNYFYERAVQILACEKTETKYTVLRGHYSISQIREIYRKSSIYFVAARESFGLPICELQACGSYVFTPYQHCCPSHWLKEDIFKEGPGLLSPNFVVYDNDIETLIEQIQNVKQRYDPLKVVDTFHQYHPHYYYGNKPEVERFLTLLEEGKIYSGKNKEYADIVALEMSVPFG
jgi:hypothetical protein